MASWRKKSTEVQIVVPKEDHDRLTSNMDELVRRMSDIAHKIEERLSCADSTPESTDPQHP